MAMPIIGACEPDSGSRYSAVRGKLAEAFRRFDIQQITQREAYDSVGVELTEEFTSLLEVLRAWASLPYDQRRPIQLAIGPEDMTHCQIADLLGIGDRTVRRRIDDGINAMVKVIYR
jgi:DNA-directed RNA polymerase specialized sigma24 family protein